MRDYHWHTINRAGTFALGKPLGHAHTMEHVAALRELYNIFPFTKRLHAYRTCVIGTFSRPHGRNKDLANGSCGHQAVGRHRHTFIKPGELFVVVGAEFAEHQRMNGS